MPLQKVKDKVDEAKNELPTDLEDDPAVFEVNISELPIVVFSLSGSCGITCLKDIADDLADDIEAVPGVRQVSLADRDGFAELQLILEGDEVLAKVLAHLTERGSSLIALEKREPTLEDVFMALTGKQLTEE